MSEFYSPMVNAYNLETFVSGGDDDELVQRVIDRKKPFAHVTMWGAEKADLQHMKKLHNKVKRLPRLVVSPLYLRTTYNKTGQAAFTPLLVFDVTQKGTLADNFDMNTLAAYYKQEGYSEVARDIIRKRNLKLSSYFKDWDWQDRAAEFSAGFHRNPWDKPRNPPVEPWETGLILGYPPEDTIESYYYGGYKFRPDNPKKAIKDFVRGIERATDKKEPPASARSVAHKYQVIQSGKL